MVHTAPKFKAQLWWALRWKLLMLASFACFHLGAAFGLSFDVSPEQSPSPQQLAELAPGSAAYLVERHDCWTQEAPADVTMPGHVVVTSDGQTRYGGARLVHLALDQVFAGVDHDLTVHAFCR